jgi:hypothetical protein
MPVTGRRILPDGQITSPYQNPLRQCQGLPREIIIFRLTENYGPLAAVPHPQEGRFATVTKRGAGCDGRGGVLSASAPTNAPPRTAKPCGPGTPTLVSTPGAKAPGRTGAIKPGTPGRARNKPSDHSRRECRTVRRTCGGYARVLFHLCTRGCGCEQHPAFPAPSDFLRDTEYASLGRNCVAGT